MSRTGGQETFQQATQDGKTTNTNYKEKARQFSQAVNERRKMIFLSNEEEQEKKLQREADIQQIHCIAQKHKLKKFLQLSKQLQKPKDEKKIKELLQVLKETNKPLPQSVIKELKMLEIMNSPYSQPLMGMIKEIESQINKRFGADQQPTQRSSRPQTIHRKHKREFSDGTVPMTLEQLNINGSSRRLELAIEAYNKDNQIIINHIGVSKESRSHSRGSSIDVSSVTQQNGKIPKSKIQLEEIKSEAEKLFTPKRNFAHNQPFPVRVGEAGQLKSGRSSRHESLITSSRSRNHQYLKYFSSSKEGTGTSNSTNNRRKTNLLSKKAQKEAFKSNEVNLGQKSSKRKKSRRSRNLSNSGAASLGLIMGVKTTLGASENSLQATQYSNQSTVEKFQALNQRQLSRNRMLMAGVMTSGTATNFSPIKQVLLEHENEESVIEVQIQGISPPKKQKSPSQQQQIVIQNMRKEE